jgi:hypothetical protein
VGIDANIAFCRSKKKGAKSLTRIRNSPAIAVGDSVPDYSLLSEKLAEYFILFTEHFRWKDVLK